MKDLGKSKKERACRRDSGAPPERPATFFDKFNPGAEKKGRGTGQGTTCACLVTRAHGGEISVESSKTDGTTVTVTLKLQ